MIEGGIISSKLYQCSNTIKRLYGISYKKKLAKYIELIKEDMIQFKDSNELNAFERISNREEYKKSDGLEQVLFMAAVVEMIEPSKY